MAWIKYKDKTSAHSGTWEYKYLHGSQQDWENLIGDCSLAEFLVEEGMIETVSWSEHYRGTDAEFVNIEDVPTDVIHDEYKATINRIKRLQEKEIDLKNSLNLK